MSSPTNEDKELNEYLQNLKKEQQKIKKVLHRNEQIISDLKKKEEDERREQYERIRRKYEENFKREKEKNARNHMSKLELYRYNQNLPIWTRPSPSIGGEKSPKKPSSKTSQRKPSSKKSPKKPSKMT